jgi:hypothetical protein
MGAAVFNGSFSWLAVGYEYGSVKQNKMSMGLHSYANLPALMQARFNWGMHDIVAKFHPVLSLPGLSIFHHQLISPFYWNTNLNLELKTVLLLVYAVLLLPCGIAAAVHSHRNDPRILVALAAPWVIFPIIICQMSERYLLWGSALTAACITVSTGLTLMSVLLTLTAAGMMAHQLMEVDTGHWPEWNNFFGQMFPDAAWMMLLIAAVFLWGAMMSSRRPASSTAEL